MGRDGSAVHPDMEPGAGSAAAAADHPRGAHRARRLLSTEPARPLSSVLCRGRRSRFSAAGPGRRCGAFFPLAPQRLLPKPPAGRGRPTTPRGPWQSGSDGGRCPRGVQRARPRLPRNSARASPHRGCED
jgi:hypothetical protein